MEISIDDFISICKANEWGYKGYENNYLDTNKVPKLFSVAKNKLATITSSDAIEYHLIKNSFKNMPMIVIDT